MSKSVQNEPFQRLALARQRAGYATASEAARAFGWNENTYRSHENGERGLRIDVAYKYAKAFKVDVDFLVLGREGSVTFEADNHKIIGYVDEEGSFVEYPANGVGGFEELVAATLIQTHGATWFAECKFQRPLLGCNPGDLLIIQGDELSFHYYAKFFGNLALIELDDGRQLLRRIRFHEETGMIDIQIYPEMGAHYATPKSINLVYAVIQRNLWRRLTKEEDKALLEDFKKNRLPSLAKMGKLPRP